MNRTVSVRVPAFIFVAAIAAILFVACTNKKGVPSGQSLENQQQNQATESLVNNQPIPHFPWSQMRQNLIEIETAEATGVQTTSFFFNHGVQDPIFTCPSIGVPIPNTMSLSNPQQVITDHSQYGGGNVVTSQMDPNGAYAPPSSSGTFVMCVGANGKPFAKYWEGHVDAVFAPAKWDPASHSVQIIGPASFNFTKAKTP